MSPEALNEILELCEAVQEQTISDAQWEQLQQLLRDSELRRLYADCMMMIGQLGECFRDSDAAHDANASIVRQMALDCLGGMQVFRPPSPQPGDAAVEFISAKSPNVSVVVPSRVLRVRTNNPPERLMREVRRRTRVVGAFLVGNSALILVAARRSAMSPAPVGRHGST